MAHLNAYYAILALPQIPYNCTECAVGASCHLIKLLVSFKQALLKSPAAQATQGKSVVLSNCKQYASTQYSTILPTAVTFAESFLPWTVDHIDCGIAHCLGMGHPGGAGEV